MKELLITSTIFFSLTAGISAQKGVDTQTQTIKDNSNRVVSRPTDASRSIDWGKGKTQVRDRLPNPYKLNSRRDVLVETIVSVLKDRKILVDEASSRLNDGIIITQPFVFSKGPVTARSELRRYGVLEFEDSAWSRGRYTLIIEIQSINGIQNNVSVNAKVEGRAGAGLTTEWSIVPSSGLAEEEFLLALVETVTGSSPDQD